MSIKLLEEVTDEFLQNFFSNVDESGVLKRREGYKIEFKRNFNWKDTKSRSNYLKSMAAFTNNEGGLLIFGVGDSPRTIIGIDNFDDIDESEITNEINEKFSQDIKFSRKTYHTANKQIGILQVYESNNKPVICTQNYSQLKASDIYYRYNSKSTKIKPGELINIINARIEKESNKWLELLKNISTVGPENIGIVNMKSGEFNYTGNKVLLDEKLLSELKVIDEYSLSQEGAPAIKIIGEVAPNAKVIREPFALVINDVIKAFLVGSNIKNPISYLKVICQEYSIAFPIWFLLNKLSKNQEELIEKLQTLKYHTGTFHGILERVKNDETAQKMIKKYRLDTAERGPIRTRVLNKLLEGKKIKYHDVEETRSLLEALSNIEPQEIEFNRVQEALRRIFNECYPYKNKTYNYLFRNILTLIDYLYFSPQNSGLPT